NEACHHCWQCERPLPRVTRSSRFSVVGLVLMVLSLISLLLPAGMPAAQVGIFNHSLLQPSTHSGEESYVWLEQSCRSSVCFALRALGSLGYPSALPFA